jgi:hypothetical protein
MPPLLKGQVVAIISDSSVVINLGRANQVSKGTKFIIFEEGEMIKDIAGHDLEKLEVVKGQVEVTNVQEHISIAQSFTIEKRIYNPLDYNPFAPREFTEIEKVPLKAKPTIKYELSAVKVGDWVRQQP